MRKPEPARARRASLRLYRDFAGAPIDDFTYLGSYQGWRSLGKNVLAVQTGINDAYLITVQGPCSELPFVNTIAVTSTDTASGAASILGGPAA